MAEPPTSPVPQLIDTFASDEPTDIAADAQFPGFLEVRAALCMVASGGADSITLCGFPDGREQLRLAGELAIGGVVVEPLIRTGGGGFDIRVRRVPPIAV